LIRAGTSDKAKGPRPEQKQKLSPLELIDSLVPTPLRGNTWGDALRHWNAEHSSKVPGDDSRQQKKQDPFFSMLDDLTKPLADDIDRQYSPLFPRLCVGTHGVMLCITEMQSTPSKFPAMIAGSRKTRPSLSNVR